MTTRNFPPRSTRRGYAMVVVLVFLALMLSMLAVSQRRLGSVLRVESGFVDAEARGDRARAMGKALDVLWTGPPPSDPYVCSTVVETSAGAKSYTITYEEQGGQHYRIRVEPTAPGDDPPPLPQSF
jgi:hypothetical protein